MSPGKTLATVGIVKSNATSGFHWQISDHTGNYRLSAVDGRWKIQQVQLVSINDQETKLVFWSLYGQKKQGLWICDSRYRFKKLEDISTTSSLSPTEFCAHLLPNLLPRKRMPGSNDMPIVLRGLRQDNNYPGLASHISKALLQLLQAEDGDKEDVVNEINSQLLANGSPRQSAQWQDQLLGEGCITLHLRDREKPYRFYLPVVPLDDGYIHGYFDPETNACLLFTRHSGKCWIVIDLEKRKAYFSQKMNRVIADVITHFVKHCLDYEEELHRLVEQGLAQQKVIVSCRDSHIGHYLWNDLSGLDYLEKLISAKPDLAQSILHLFVAGEPIYAPLHRLFPNLTAAVPVSPKIHTDLRPIIYSERCQYMRACDDHIAASLAEDIRDHSLHNDWLHDWLPANRLPNNDLLVQLQLQEELPPKPRAQLNVVCFYLRINNRAPANQVEFAVALFKRLLQDQRANAATHFFICGSNTHSGSAIRSFRESVGTCPDWVNEQKLTLQIIKEVKETCGHHNIFSLIGSVISHELSIVHRADLIVIPWGAGMAKTKWILNHRCLVHASPWILLNQQRMRKLYEETSYREGVVKDLYFPQECVASIDSEEWERQQKLDPERCAMIRNGADQQDPKRCNYMFHLDAAVEFVCTSLPETSEREGAPGLRPPHMARLSLNQ